MKKVIELTPNLETILRDENVHAIHEGLHVTIRVLEDSIEISGAPRSARRAQLIFTDYAALVKAGEKLSSDDLHALIKLVVKDPTATLAKLAAAAKKRTPVRFKSVQPRNTNQNKYIELISANDMVFGIGPAGTGKTYLAVALAISALLSKSVRRIVLVRPAVEAGEKLGFLPGTMQDKVDPYMRPLYDAMHEMVDAKKVKTYIEDGTIEIAPVAFMRGRTLTDSFIIVDEAQNTTCEQMKMLLTRLGSGSKLVITGDITQVDLPNGRSGLVDVLPILKDVAGIGIQYFEEADVVRHPLVQKVVHAYDAVKKIPLSGK